MSSLRSAVAYENFIFTQKYAIAERYYFLTFSFEGKFRKYDISVKRKRTKTNEKVIFPVLFTNFRQTKILFFILCLTQIIWWTFSYDAKNHFWNKVAPFNFPVFFCQFYVICVMFTSKGSNMVVESIFERLFCISKVNFVIVVGLGRRYFSLVNYTWRQTFPTYRPILGQYNISAVRLIFDFVILDCEYSCCDCL